MVVKTWNRFNCCNTDIGWTPQFSNKSDWGCIIQDPRLLQLLHEVKFLDTFPPALLYLAPHTASWPVQSPPTLGLALWPPHRVCFPVSKEKHLCFLSVFPASDTAAPIVPVESKLNAVTFKQTPCSPEGDTCPAVSPGFEAVIRAVVGCLGDNMLSEPGRPRDRQTVGPGFGLLFCSICQSLWLWLESS